MHAIRQYAFGPVENLRYEEVADPRPGPGQVRIAVQAAGVHFIDTSIRAGSTGLPFPLPDLPMVPGREVAGVVDQIGPGVDEAWLGTRVVALLAQGSGGYAELAVGDVGALHVLPDDVADDAAVAMIGTGRTTMGILDVARLTSGDVALVTAAAGGIGALLMQEARNVGATVVGVAGGRTKVERVRRLAAVVAAREGSGGDVVAVDYTTPDWTATVREATSGQEPTVAFDGVGGELGRGALELLGVGGRLIMFGWSSGEPTRVTVGDLYERGITASAAIGARILRRPGGMRPLEERALAAAASGRLIPLVGQSFPLKDAAAAHTAIETRATEGKTVLVP